MQNNKSFGNNGLTKEFYESCWDEIKQIFINSEMEVKNKGELSHSGNNQIKRKKESDKRYFKNWNPISFLNFDTKIISKALSEKLKHVLSWHKKLHTLKTDSFEKIVD